MYGELSDSAVRVKTLVQFLCFQRKIIDLLSNQLSELFDFLKYVLMFSVFTQGLLKDGQESFSKIYKLFF